MAGLLVLGAAAIWLLFAVRFGRWTASVFRTSSVSAVAGVVAFAGVVILPFTDEILGRYQFRRVCAAEATVWVRPNAAAVLAAKARPSLKDLQGFAFPIQEQVSEYVDLATGEPFLRVRAFHTPGGFVMRSGLNMGSSTSCWPDRWSEPYKTLKLDELLKRGKT